ncbi:MAG: hypothetical protein OEX00_12235, partial [Gammaproteobacteria bacterium]|nr:hypothetical protein [Gammaproteobacteria bacterium]
SYGVIVSTLSFTAWATYDYAVNGPTMHMSKKRSYSVPKHHALGVGNSWFVDAARGGKKNQ